MAVGEGWQFLKIRGIPLRIHPSWLVILLLITMAFQQRYSIVIRPPLAEGSLWLLGFSSALLFFLSVLLHELGHSLVAIRQGVKVRSITLFLLGGQATVDRECATARGALLVAAAGPAVSLVLGVGLLLASHPITHQSRVLGEMVTQLGVLNLVLGLFNLLPGLPLDGGLIVKALVWQATGSMRKGIEVANASGRFLSLMLVGLGTVLLLRGAGIGGVWLILLGWFGLGAARNQHQMLMVQQALKDLKVKDVARRRFRVLEASETLRTLSRIQLDGPAVGLEPAETSGTLGAGAKPALNPSGGSRPEGAPEWLLVCDHGRWRGVIDDQPLQNLPVQCWDRERIGDHIRPLSELPSIAETAPLWQAALRLEESPQSRLLVLSPAGLPSGTVERPELGDAVLKRMGLRLPDTMLAAARRQNGYPLGLALDRVAQTMVRSGEVSDTAAQPVSR